MDCRQLRGIYIIGQIQRTGTNFLYNLLLKHPDIVKSNQPGEDWLMYNSQYLDRYIEETSQRWNTKWKGMDIEFRKEKLKNSFQEALCKFLNETDLGINSKKVISKTPNTIGIEYFNEFFPSFIPIIVIRDGRNAVESLVNSFNWSYEKCMKDWADSASRIVKFRKENKDALVIKYEDLNSKTFELMSKILNYAKLDLNKYDFSNIPNLEIIGSSNSTPIKGKVDWDVKEVKDENFNPNNRFLDWDNGKRKMYNDLCGKMALELEYGIF